MAKEIERKFLVHPRKWSDLGAGLIIRQGYLCASKQSLGARAHLRRPRAT